MGGRRNNATSMRMWLTGASQSTQTSYDYSTLDSSLSSIDRVKSRRRNQRQKKPTSSGKKSSQNLLRLTSQQDFGVDARDDVATGRRGQQPKKSKPAKTKKRGDKKKSRSRSRSRVREPVYIDADNSLLSDGGSDSEHESADATGIISVHSEDYKRRPSKARGRRSSSRRHRNRCATPPPRPPTPEPPVKKAERMIEKIEDMISPKSSDAEESNPSTDSRVQDGVTNFVVQNEVNQLTIQNTIYGNVEKLHMHVSDGFRVFRGHYETQTQFLSTSLRSTYIISSKPEGGVRLHPPSQVVQ